MGMRSFFVFLGVFAVLSSCREKPVIKKAPEKNYYLEFKSEPGAEWGASTILLTKRNLLGAKYYYGAPPHMAEWIQGVGYADSVDVSELDEHFRQVHHFRDISEYKESDAEAEKIVITWRKPKNGLANFDFHSYRKLGSDKWQSVFNPGNFRYHTAHPEAPDKDYSEWMSKLIVDLTFK
jgi:hypothetical protein